MLKKTPIDRIRFAVRATPDKCSAAWVIFSHGDDIYVGNRALSGVVKTSLHKDRNCHVAIEDRVARQIRAQGGQLSDRHHVRWQRNVTPAIGAVHVLSVYFPTQFLWKPEPKQEPGKTIDLLRAAPLGEMLEVAIFYARVAEAQAIASFARGGYPLYSMALSTGETAWTVVRYRPFDPRIVPDPRSAQRFARTYSRRALAMQPGERMEGLTALVCFDPVPPQNTVIVMEVGPMTLTKNTAPAQSQADAQ